MTVAAVHCLATHVSPALQFLSFLHEVTTAATSWITSCCSVWVWTSSVGSDLAFSYVSVSGTETHCLFWQVSPTEHYLSFLHWVGVTISSSVTGTTTTASSSERVGREQSLLRHTSPAWQFLSFLHLTAFTDCSAAVHCLFMHWKPESQFLSFLHLAPAADITYEASMVTFPECRASRVSVASCPLIRVKLSSAMIESESFKNFMFKIINIILIF